eukprot:2805576-Rhodomonas_salina.1
MMSTPGYLICQWSDDMLSPVRLYWAVPGYPGYTENDGLLSLQDDKVVGNQWPGACVPVPNGPNGGETPGVDSQSQRQLLLYRAYPGVLVYLFPGYPGTRVPGIPGKWENPGTQPYRNLVAALLKLDLVSQRQTAWKESDDWYD